MVEEDKATVVSDKSGNWPNMGTSSRKVVPLESVEISSSDEAASRNRSRAKSSAAFSDAAELVCASVNTYGDEHEEVLSLVALRGGIPSETQKLFTGNGLLDPKSGMCQKWDRLMVLLLTFTAIITPFEVAFLETTLGVMFVINRFVDCCFIVDISLNFLLDPEDPSIPLPTHAQIASKYCAFWFWVDVIGTIPFDAVNLMEHGDGSDGVQLIRIMRLLRLLKISRLTRATRILDRLQDHVAINYSFITLVNAAFLVVLVSHWMACLWYLAGSWSLDTWETNWATVNFGAESSASKFELYVASCYFAIMTMSTIGYGDIAPVNPVEEIVACFFMLIGAMFYAYVITQVTDAVTALRGDTVQYREMMDKINAFMEKHGLRNDIRVIVRRYLRTKSSGHGAADINKLMSLLSPDLQENIAGEMHKNWIHGSTLFKDAPPPLQHKIAARFKPVDFPAGECIIEVGQEVDLLYCLTKGLVMDAGRIKSGTRFSRALIGEDYMFGRHAHLGVGRSPCIVLALTHCSIFTITNLELNQLLSEFPDFNRTINQRAVRYGFREHVYAYTQAVRLWRNQPRMFRKTDEQLTQQYLWKLKMLDRHAENTGQVIKVQKLWRGYLMRHAFACRQVAAPTGRKRGRLEMKNVGVSTEAQVAALRTDFFKFEKEVRADAMAAEAHDRKMSTDVRNIWSEIERQSSALKRVEAQSRLTQESMEDVKTLLKGIIHTKMMEQKQQNQ